MKTENMQFLSRACRQMRANEAAYLSHHALVIVIILVIVITGKQEKEDSSAFSKSGKTNHKLKIAHTHRISKSAQT